MEGGLSKFSIVNRGIVRRRDFHTWSPRIALADVCTGAPVTPWIMGICIFYLTIYTAIA